MCAEFKSERRGTENISQCSQSEHLCTENLFWEQFAGVVYREHMNGSFHCLHKFHKPLDAMIGALYGEKKQQHGFENSLKISATMWCCNYRPIYIGKNQNPKNLGFCCTVYTARKTHNIRGFWHEKRMREKTRISYLCFGKWCACATSLYLWPYTCSAHYVAGRGRVIPLKVTYHVTKNPNNTGEIGASVYIAKKPVKFWRSFKTSRCGGGFFDSGFLECLGEVA